MAPRGRDRPMCWTAARHVERGQRCPERQPLGQMSLCGGPEVTQDVAVLGRLGLSSGVCVACRGRWEQPSADRAGPHLLIPERSAALWLWHRGARCCDLTCSSLRSGVGDGGRSSDPGSSSWTSQRSPASRPFLTPRLLPAQAPLQPGFSSWDSFQFSRVGK